MRFKLVIYSIMTAYLCSFIHSFSLSYPYLPTNVKSIHGSHIYNHKALFSSIPSNHGDEWIDRAPCLDGLCTSEPVSMVDSFSNTSTFSTRMDSSSTPTTPVSSHSSSSRIGLAMERLGAEKIGPTVWSEFGRLAQEYKIQANLGQGFPNWTPPQFAIDSLVDAATDCSHMSPHQYTRTAGHVNLVIQLARRYSIHLKRNVDAMSEVAVTVGASQALYLALQTLLRPGECILQ